MTIWRYQARPERVVDGDTIDVTVDMGFNVQRNSVRLRLVGIDTAEIFGVSRSSEEAQRGHEQRAFVEGWIGSAMATDDEWPVIIQTEKTGKYGRYVTDIQRKSDEEWLTAALIERWPEVEDT